MNIQKAVTLATGIAVLALAAWAVAQPSRWQVIGAFSTGLEARTNAQSHNAELAAQQIDDKIIPSHGEFSFNRTVGSWTADRGYVKAPVSYDGELIPAWGGGVCQTSSTLYNAALLAGMDVIERHRHKFPARYVPPGQDAAVAQYNIDLRLKNPYSFPLKIEAKVHGDRLICKILAQHSIDRHITIERDIKRVIAPGEVIRFSNTGRSTRWHVINHGQPGLQVAVYRRINTGSRSSRALVSEDTYPPLNRLVKGE